mmetsp:Transcript_23958/g.29785  ORF Transcript_23958/g.29785 Transcript_23958/m.29785 type:complete len:271 (-) Transcript_23958:463-1275(-)
MTALGRSPRTRRSFPSSRQPCSRATGTSLPGSTRRSTPLTASCTALKRHHPRRLSGICSGALKIPLPAPTLSRATRFKHLSRTRRVRASFTTMTTSSCITRMTGISLATKGHTTMTRAKAATLLSTTAGPMTPGTGMGALSSTRVTPSCGRSTSPRLASSSSRLGSSGPTSPRQTTRATPPRPVSRRSRRTWSLSRVKLRRRSQPLTKSLSRTSRESRRRLRAKSSRWSVSLRRTSWRSRRRSALSPRDSRPCSRARTRSGQLLLLSYFS